MHKEELEHIDYMSINTTLRNKSTNFDTILKEYLTTNHRHNLNDTLQDQLKNLELHIFLCKHVISNIETKFNIINKNIESSLTTVPTKDKSNTKTNTKPNAKKLDSDVIKQVNIKVNNNIKLLLNLDNVELTINQLNKHLNQYCINNNLIKCKHVILNTELKKICKCKKDKILIDELINYIKFKVV